MGVLASRAGALRAVAVVLATLGSLLVAAAEDTAGEAVQAQPNVQAESAAPAEPAAQDDGASRKAEQEAAPGRSETPAGSAAELPSLTLKESIRVEANTDLPQDI